MLDKQAQLKLSHLYHDKTASQFGSANEDCFSGDAEVERQYVERLKSQREKIETLYSKYGSLFKDLKNKEGQAKEKEKTIYNMESKCKIMTTNQESGIIRQQNKENSTIQRALSDLDQSNAFLHGHYRVKDAASSQKYEELEAHNDELMSKLRSLSKKYQQKEEQYSQTMKKFQRKLDQALIETRRQKDEHINEQQLLKSALMQKDEEIKLLQTENQCLKDRVCELEAYVNQLIYESEARLDESQKEKKLQLKLLRNEIDTLRQTNCSLQKKRLKLKQELQTKQSALSQMTLVLEHYEKQSSQTFSQMKQQFAQERSQLKQQLIQSQNYTLKLERKVVDCLRREEYLHVKIKKYENCMSAKRNLREVEREQLDKINKLLSMP